MLGRVKRGHALEWSAAQVRVSELVVVEEDAEPSYLYGLLFSTLHVDDYDRLVWDPMSIHPTIAVGSYSLFRS